MSSYLQYKLSGGELYQCRQPNPILSAWGEDPSSVGAISSLYRETSKTLDHQHRDSFRHENLVTAVTFGEDIKFPIADKLNTAQGHCVNKDIKFKHKLNQQPGYDKKDHKIHIKALLDKKE